MDKPTRLGGLPGSAARGEGDLSQCQVRHMVYSQVPLHCLDICYFEGGSTTRDVIRKPMYQFPMQFSLPHDLDTNR